MKQVLLFAVAAMLYFPTLSKAQWTEISEHRTFIRDMEAVGDTLYVGGRFTIVNGQSCYHMSKYDGTNVTAYTTNPGSTGGIYSMVNFNGVLWAGCSYPLGSNWGIGYWDGATWQDGEGFFPNNGTGWEAAYVDGNDLYMGGSTGNVMTRTSTTSWVNLPSTDSIVDEIYDITKHNGRIVIGGDMDSANSVFISNIAFYDGAAWQPFGTGVDSSVYSLEVLGTDLYAAGVFNNAGGNAAKYIAKWNGSTWSAVGGSVTGTGNAGIQDMLVYNNRLYVCGDFDEIGGVASTGVAYWDGANWNDVGFPVLSGGHPAAMEVFNYGLYVGTNEGASGIDTSHVYMMALSGVGIADNDAEASFLMFPNPTDVILNIDFTEAISEIVIFDQAGKEVIRQSDLNATFTSVDVAELKSGVYIVECHTNDGVMKQRFIKK